MEAHEWSCCGTMNGLSRGSATHLGERGEEGVEVLGEKEAWDGQHGHAAVLELGLTELVHLLLVGAGRKAERVEALRKRLCRGRVGANERVFEGLAVATFPGPPNDPTELFMQTGIPWSRRHRRGAR